MNPSEPTGGSSPRGGGRRPTGRRSPFDGARDPARGRSSLDGDREPTDRSSPLGSSPPQRDRQRRDGDPRRREDSEARRVAAGATLAPPRYGRYVGLLALAILVVVTLSLVLTKPHGVGGIKTGHRIPPFAAPLAGGDLTDRAVNATTHPGESGAGGLAACQVHGAGVLNVCELYERGPLVLALFVDSGSCANVLDDMQTLAHEFPGVSFAGVAIKGERDPLRKLISAHRLDAVQVGLDPEGVLVDLYGVATCPQISFVLPGGVVQSPALLGQPPLNTLRARVSELVAAARARGWRPSR